MDIINAYMKRKNIQPELQTRVREYLNFIWMEEKTQNIEEEIKIINSLSASLKEELNLESFGFFVKKNPLFIHFFSDDSLKSFVNVMKELFFTPDDVIFHVFTFFFISWKLLKIFSKIREKKIQLFILLKKEQLIYIQILTKPQS